MVVLIEVSNHGGPAVVSCYLLYGYIDSISLSYLVVSRRVWILIFRTVVTAVEDRYLDIVY